MPQHSDLFGGTAGRQAFKRRMVDMAPASVMVLLLVMLSFGAWVDADDGSVPLVCTCGEQDVVHASSSGVTEEWFTQVAGQAHVATHHGRGRRGM